MRADPPRPIRILVAFTVAFAATTCALFEDLLGLSLAHDLALAAALGALAGAIAPNRGAGTLRLLSAIGGAAACVCGFMMLHWWFATHPDTLRATVVVIDLFAMAPATLATHWLLSRLMSRPFG